MSVQAENLEKNMAKLTITVPAETVDKAMEAVYRKNKSKYSVPGFRKGKVSRKMMENLYGKGIFLEDAINSILPEEYNKAVQESELDIVSEPELEFTQTEPGKDLIFVATVAVKPEVTLGDYKGVEVKKVVVEVTDDDIMKVIKSEQEKNAVTVNIEDRAVKDGDNTTIDFEGFVDGVAFEGGKGTDYPLTIGSNAFIPGFESQLVGAELNKEVEINVTFPEDYHSEELKGKDATFKVTVKKIEEKQLPEIDDEFASEVSEFDTLDEYKADLKATLKVKKEKAAKNTKEGLVIDQIIENSTMEIPDAMLDTTKEQMLNEFSQQLSYQGLSVDQYFQFTGMTKEKFLETSTPEAERRIKSRLVLEAIAKAEDIQVSEEELNDELKKMADMYQMDLEQLTGLVGDSEKDAIKQDIAVQKAVDLVTEAAVEK